ncbi:hypothetical protein RHMOL_Rhmol08G0156900 [Rhododendron molle]|uniref:Uncharacterized protein n=1 Tax=Rhododendron molle TaxID=49168 RepID=A0ACC0MNX7_RHOML|nr:hypothetical protein RHMOL_Rhmol08G0156900 [Rhododendron molle]
MLEEKPDIGEIVLEGKEERARAIAAWEAAEKAKRERKDREEPLREVEAKERAAEEAQGPRVTAVAEAATMRRPNYVAETYTPSTPHLLIPSGFSAYTPQRSEYDDETVLRDPQTHIANTWAEDDVDEAYLGFYIEGEVIPNERRQLGSFNPLVDKLSEVVRKFHHESDPTDNIVPVEELRPYAALEDDCLVMAIDEVPADLWDVDEIVDLKSNLLPDDLWDVDKVVDIQMGNEVWTVNSALVDAGFWDSPFVMNPGVPFEEAAAQDPAF